MSLVSFPECFQQLTSYPPFLWQERLFREICAGDIPSICDIPTGLGKTSILAIWLLALAEQASQPDAKLILPRRLVYVVNRRVVVDQATSDANGLLDTLRNSRGTPLESVAKALSELAAIPDGEKPFALSTLRGQYADNREWSADPCRPAIIVGTVDMIGSRLLFSAYRAGYKTKPLYAGFLGQDALVIHDEAHLEPAFQQLIEAIEEEQRQSHLPNSASSRDSKPIRVMQLSATTRERKPGFALTGKTTRDDSAPNQASTERRRFELTDEEKAEGEVFKRLNAPKRLQFHPLTDAKQLPEKLIELAKRHEGANVAVLIFARTVKDVKDVAAKLPAARCETLTGTMRGKERDDLAKKEVFRRFLPASSGGLPALEGTFYLVCTSAGEVGVNLSADHIVCDLTTLESMTQRLGRVNRFGERADTEADVIYPVDLKATTKELAPDELRRKKTLALLEQLNGDASPAALRSLSGFDPDEVFTERPATLETSDILFDAWAMTSITDPLSGRPPVEPYLRGVLDDKRATTQVAWRDEVELLTNSKNGDLIVPFQERDLKSLLADYPLKPVELLQDRSDRVSETLAKLAKKKPENAKVSVWLMDMRGEVSRHSLGDLTDKKNKDRINYCLLLLPPSLGGLSDQGMLDGNADARVKDVSDKWLDENDLPRRGRELTDNAVEHQPPHRMRLIRGVIDTKPDASEEAEDDESSNSQRYWWWYEAVKGADTEGSTFARKAVSLEIHTSNVEDHARRFSDKLGLSAQEAEVVRLAGKYHDLGKMRVSWQLGIGNVEAGTWWAKSGSRKAAHEFNSPYRHEFGSLLDAMADQKFCDSLKAMPDHLQDLALHLIAAHHGRARPHFPAEEIFDWQHPKADADALAAETPRRFARLQRRYGRWGLAFLESLLRAADYAASANPSETLEETP